MVREELEKCCLAVEEGTEILVENTIRRQNGRVIYCSGEVLGVEVQGHRETWPAEVCEEVQSSSESPHRNI